MATRTDEQFDVIVIGAGFAGLYMLKKLRDLGRRARVLEAASSIGGTWFWNRYPGARCDVESALYSYSFSTELQRDWRWSQRYADQGEILEYIDHVADRFGLRSDIDLNTRVTAAHYDEAKNKWRADTACGRKLEATFLITAVGCLSTCYTPDIEGLSSFKGRLLHTGQWPAQVLDFSNDRVAVIGTGSSGVQLIPEMAKRAAHLTVFQRTPCYSLPARNYPLTEAIQDSLQAQYPELRDLARRGKIHGGGDVFVGELRLPRAPSALELSAEERNAEFEARWPFGGVVPLLAFQDIPTNEAANEAACDFIRSKIRSRVGDAELAERLCPYDYPIGSKRICLDTDYYETYKRGNVSLVDVRNDPIAYVNDTSVVLRSGAEHRVDTLIMATGFDAVTGSLLKLNLTGRNGAKLAELWAKGPSTYLGLSIAGFPNLFTITGPLSPSSLSNVMVSIEQHVEWIADCLAYMQARDFNLMEADSTAETAWKRTVEETAAGAISTKANSWYVGANIPGKARSVLAYTGGVGRYREICDQVKDQNYEGFTVGKACA